MLKLLSKDVDFSWNSFFKAAFEALKELSMALVLRGPNWSIPPIPHFYRCFKQTPWSYFGPKEKQSSYAIYFISENLAPAVLNLYSH